MSSPQKSQQGVEASIEEAMRRGEFDDLKGKGKPLNLDEYFEAPEEVRLSLSLLKDSGFLPREVELLNEITGLEAELKLSSDAAKRAKLRKAIQERRLSYDLLRERSLGHNRRKK